MFLDEHEGSEQLWKEKSHGARLNSCRRYLGIPVHKNRLNNTICRFFRLWKNGRYSSLLADCGWITNDADQRGRVEGILKALSTAVVGTRCGFYGRMKTGEPREKPSKDGKNPLRTAKTLEGRQKLSKDGKNSRRTAKTLEGWQKLSKDGKGPLRTVKKPLELHMILFSGNTWLFITFMKHWI